VNDRVIIMSLLTVRSRDLSLKRDTYLPTEALSQSFSAKSAIRTWAA
jgi:hypothetical protein